MVAQPGASFGTLLRDFRRRCLDPGTGKPFSQSILTEELERAVGVRYSYATISDWERNKRTIDKDDRRVLIGLIQVLHEGGGLQTARQAARLLHAGNYRHLDGREQQHVFGRVESDLGAYELFLDTVPVRLRRQLMPPLADLLAQLDSVEPRHWTTWLLHTLIWMSRRLPSQRFWFLLPWLGIWLLALSLLAPALAGPPVDEAAFRGVLLWHVGGVVGLPLLIGWQTGLACQSAWSRHRLARRQLYLTTYWGALAGFHAGYTLIALSALLLHYWIRLPASGEVLAISVAFPIVTGHIMAFNAPGILAKRPKRPPWHDVINVFLVAGAGPLWGLIFYVAPAWSARPLPALTVAGSITLIVLGLAFRHYRQMRLPQLAKLGWIVWLPLLVLWQWAGDLGLRTGLIGGLFVVLVWWRLPINNDSHSN